MLNIEMYNTESYNNKGKVLNMKEPEKKEETLEEAYARVYDYEPSKEELDKLYGEEFNKWCDELLKDI